MIEELVREMDALRKLGDTEVAHSLADRLLLAALRELGTLENNREKDEIEDLIASYEAVPKWFA